MNLKKLFCRHDWHVHGKAPDAARQRVYGYANVSLGIIGTIATFHAGAESAPLSFFAIVAATSLVLGFIIQGMYGFYLLDSDVDVTFAEDRTCLKCNKLSLAGTKLAEQLDLRHEKSRIENEARDILVAKANDKYYRYLDMRDKAST